jgi:hypothetical protein
LGLEKTQQSGIFNVYKYGELEPFGPHTPSRLISLIGPDRDLFLKGRRAENQGLGIGAHTYYRRVVDNQWHRLIGEIIQVAQQVLAPEAIVNLLKEAKEEQQFSKAVDMIKNAIPESLLIKGHNPITLLYSALSEGLHGMSDDECLSQAFDIRVILSTLAEKLQQALKDDAELNSALTNLLRNNNKSSPEPEN